jgi:transposase
MKTEEQRQLSAEVKRMSFYDERRLKALQLLESLLARHWPELTEVLELTSATLAALLSRYGSPAAVSADSEGARELMREASHGRLSTESIDAVVESARTTRGMPAIAAETALLMELAREAQLARQQTDEAKKPVVARVAHDEGAKHMARVVGHVTAGVLLDDGGDPRRYSGARQYVKALGLNLKVRQSGECQGQLKLTKRGPARARRYLYYAVLRLVQADAVVGAWYRRKVARDGERCRGRGVVAVMRKLAAALYHVARGELFDSSKLFDTNKLTLLAGNG